MSAMTRQPRAATGRTSRNVLPVTRGAKPAALTPGAQGKMLGRDRPGMQEVEDAHERPHWRQRPGLRPGAGDRVLRGEARPEAVRARGRAPVRALLRGGRDEARHLRERDGRSEPAYPGELRRR